MAEPTKRQDIEPDRGDTGHPDDASATAGSHGGVHSVTAGRPSFWDALFAPVDIGFLVYFRIVFGLLLLASVGYYYAIDLVHEKYILPQFHFTYPGFEWVRPWPGALGAHLHFLVIGLAAAGMTVGLFYRASAFLFALAYTHLFLIDKAYFQNHFYLLCLLGWVMAFLPAHRAFSVDALWRPRIRSSAVPAWTLWLLRFHIGVPYFFGGIAKLNPDWLEGAPMRAILAGHTAFPVIGRFFAEEWCVQLFAQGGLLLDLLVVPALLWRRTRLAAYIVAVLFHLMNHMLFYIGIFPWFMIFATVIFFPPDWPRVLIGLPTHTHKPRIAQRLSWARLSPLRRAGVVFLGIWVVFHTVSPLRHLAYEGDPSWTEEGHEFAWHMMLREKRCLVKFYVTEPKSGLTGLVDPVGDRTITPFQFMMMSHEPRMIHDFSLFLAEKFRKMNYEGVEVRVLALVSLNGRKPQLMIDPTVNLAAEPRTFRRPRWIMPLVEPLPEKRWEVPKRYWRQHVDLPPLPYLNENNGPARPRALHSSKLLGRRST